MIELPDEYPYEIVFYEEDGDEPVLRWMREELPASKRRALGLAMRHYLQKEGPDLCKNKRLCEPVGDGVYEFKLRYNLKDLTSRIGLPYKETGPEDNEDVMLRVFWFLDEAEVVLLTNGYDKGKNPGSRHQQAQIALAKDRKKKWLARKAREAKEAKKSPGASAKKTKKPGKRK